MHLLHIRFSAVRTFLRDRHESINPGLLYKEWDLFCQQITFFKHFRKIVALGWGDDSSPDTAAVLNEKPKIVCLQVTKVNL